MTSDYPPGRVAFLLAHYALLAAGRYPRDPNAPEGYRGLRYADAPHVAACIAKADLDRAIALMPLRTRERAIEWLRSPRDPAPTWLVDAVCEVMQSLPRGTAEADERPRPTGPAPAKHVPAPSWSYWQVAGLMVRLGASPSG